MKHFKWDGRSYVIQSLQFRQGGPNSDPVREVARIREPDLPGGFHNIFVYKHSNGRVYLFATVSGPFAHVYDLETLIEEGPENALAGRVPVPGAEVFDMSDPADPQTVAYYDTYLGPLNSANPASCAAPSASTATRTGSSW